MLQEAQTLCGMNIIRINHRLTYLNLAPELTTNSLQVPIHNVSSETNLLSAWFNVVKKSSLNPVYPLAIILWIKITIWPTANHTHKSQITTNHDAAPKLTIYTSTASLNIWLCICYYFWWVIMTNTSLHSEFYGKTWTKPTVFVEQHFIFGGCLRTCPNRPKTK